MAGGILMLLLRAVQHACYGYQSGNFLSGVEHSSPDRRLPVLLAAGVFAGAVLFFLRRVIGKGRGLTRAIWKESGTMPSLPALIDAIVSIIIVAMGVSLGREGALKEAGAVVANKVSDWWTANPSQRHVLVACGAGAGMAAAYNVPFGGAVFALEVLLGTMAMPAVLAALTTSFVATAVSWLFLPDQPTYIVTSATLSSPLLLWAVLAGPLCGVVSAAYIRAIRWAVTHKPKGWKVLWMPVVVFGILGAVSIRYPELLGNGKNLVQLAYLDQIGPGLMLVLLVLKPLATISCLRSGAPGGLFTPTMTFGALLGAVLAHLWGLVIPTGPVGAYAIIGSWGGAGGGKSRPDFVDCIRPRTYPSRGFADGPAVDRGGRRYHHGKAAGVALDLLRTRLTQLL